MHRDPLNTPNRRLNTKNFTETLLRLFGLNTTHGVAGSIAIICSATIQILSVGAKIFARRKLGIRKAGRLRVIAHVALTLSPVFIRDNVLANNQKTFLILYSVVLIILAISNYISFFKRKGPERITYFEGYGLFSNSGIISNLTRILDPFLIALIAWSLLQFWGDAFRPTAYLLIASASVFLLEELLFIYDQRNLDLDRIDIPSIGMQNSEKDSSNLGY